MLTLEGPPPRSREGIGGRGSESDRRDSATDLLPPSAQRNLSLLLLTCLGIGALIWWQWPRVQTLVRQIPWRSQWQKMRHRRHLNQARRLMIRQLRGGANTSPAILRTTLDRWLEACFNLPAPQAWTAFRAFCDQNLEGRQALHALQRRLYGPDQAELDEAQRHTLIRVIEYLSTPPRKQRRHPAELPPLYPSVRPRG